MKPFNFTSRRSPVYGLNGIVATSQPLATAAGVALNVTEQTSTGIGGDMFALYYYYSAKSRLVPPYLAGSHGYEPPDIG